MEYQVLFYFYSIFLMFCIIFNFDKITIILIATIICSYFTV